MTGDIFNVKGPNQQGGITAGQVNVGKQQRRLNNTLQNHLIQKLNFDDEIEVNTIQGDQEAFIFAEEIKSFLENEGYHVDGVNQCIYKQSIIGQRIERDGVTKKVSIIIGGNL